MPVLIVSTILLTQLSIARFRHLFLPDPHADGPDDGGTSTFVSGLAEGLAMSALAGFSAAGAVCDTALESLAGACLVTVLHLARFHDLANADTTQHDPGVLTGLVLGTYFFD